MRRSSIESKDRAHRRRAHVSKIETASPGAASHQDSGSQKSGHGQNQEGAQQQQAVAGAAPAPQETKHKHVPQASRASGASGQHQHAQPQKGAGTPTGAGSGGGGGGGGGKGANQASSPSTGFRFYINKPQAIVIDLLGVLVCRSFMSSSKEFRDFFQHNVLEYLNDSWKQKQLKIMLNFFRCSQQTVPDDFKLADREEPKEEQIKQAKKHVLWKLRNDPTNSALSLFMLSITEWGYKNRMLTTQIYDDVVSTLKYWKDEAKVPVYVGVGSADFLIMVLSNTNVGNILPYFNGHMNIMDFDGTKANKDFRKLMALLRCQPDRVLYLTRFRQDCKRAMEMGMQSLIVLRQDFDNHGLVEQLKLKRQNSTSIDGSRMARGYGLLGEGTSPPARGNQLAAVDKNPDMKKQMENNISSLSLIDDHDETDRYNTQSSQIVEQDLVRYSVVLSLAEISFK